MVAKDLGYVEDGRKLYHHADENNLQEFKNAVILGLKRSTSNKEKQWD
jgi:hypothetical protein